MLRPDGIERFDRRRDNAHTAVLPSRATYRYANLDDVIASKEVAGRATDREALPRRRRLAQLRRRRGLHE